MRLLVAPRRIKSVPSAYAFLSKDHQDVSQRAVNMLRALSPERKRGLRIAASHQVDTIQSRVGNMYPGAGALTFLWRVTLSAGDMYHAGSPPGRPFRAPHH